MRLLNFHRISITSVFLSHLIGACPNAICSTDVRTYAYNGSSSIIERVAASEGCIAHGEKYTVFIEYKTPTSFSWSIEINGSLVPDPTPFITERKMNATLAISPDLYGPPGNIPMKITASYGVRYLSDFVIRRIICTRPLSNDMSVTITKAGVQGKLILFNIKKKSKTSVGNFSIDFGDGTRQAMPNFTLSSQIVRKIYTHAKKYTFKWKCYDKDKISQGTGEVNITAYHPVRASERYIFPPKIQLSWPNNSVDLYITSSCTSKPPTNAMYRINYGDGSTYTSWAKVPRYECGKSAKLPRYTYDKSGCYSVHFQMKNLLGFNSDKSNVLINQTFNSVQLRFQSIPPLLPSGKIIKNDSVTYLPSDYPFQVEAVVNASTCCQFEWKFSTPSLSMSTGNSNKVIVKRFVGASKDFVLTAKVTCKLKKFEQKRRIILLKHVQSITMLTVDPNLRGGANFYLLVKEPGSSPDVTIDFGDGNIIKEKSPIFKDAMALPNMLNVPGVFNMDIGSLKCLYREHKYVSSGLFHVVINVTDRVRKLTARRPILFSKSPCSRPRMLILKKDRVRGYFNFSIGVTFTVQSSITILCGDWINSNAKWEMFASNKKDMARIIVAESDRKIK